MEFVQVQKAVHLIW